MGIAEPPVFAPLGGDDDIDIRDAASLEFLGTRELRCLHQFPAKSIICLVEKHPALEMLRYRYVSRC